MGRPPGLLALRRRVGRPHWHRCGGGGPFLSSPAQARLPSRKGGKQNILSMRAQRGNRKVVHIAHLCLRAHRSSLPSCLQQPLTRGPEGLTSLAAMRGLSVSSDSLSLRALCITAGSIPAQLKMSHIHINKGCAQPVHQLNGAGTHVNQGAEILFCLSTSKAFFS